GNNLINALLLVTSLLVALAILFAGPIVTAYARNFGNVPGKLELTIRLTRILLPFLVMVAVVQWPSLRREDFRDHALLDLRDPALHQVLRPHWARHGRA